MKIFLAIVSNFIEAKALSLIIQQQSLTNIKNISACPEVGTDLKGQCHKIFNFRFFS
jgi:hypothetical protein